MSHPPLTRRQMDVLKAFAAYQINHSIAPTLEELGQHFGVNRVTVYGHIQALLQKGYLENLLPGASRGLDLTEVGQQLLRPAPKVEFAPASASSGKDGRRAFEGKPPAGALTWQEPIPLVGRIAAGGPIEAIEQNEGQSLQELLRPQGSTFLLEVNGESMIEAHIQSGDLVLVNRDQQPQSGDIVVAVLQRDGIEEATLKYFRPQSAETVMLQPANPAVAPIYANRRELSIRGVVSSVIRRYR